MGRPFTVLGVDNDDEQADLAQLVKDGTVTWRFWFTHGTVAEPTFVRWNIAGVPSVVVLDHRGIIRVRYAGTPGLETLEKVVNELAKEAEGPADRARFHTRSPLLGRRRAGTRGSRAVTNALATGTHAITIRVDKQWRRPMRSGSRSRSQPARRPSSRSSAGDDRSIDLIIGGPFAPARLPPTPRQPRD